MIKAARLARSPRLRRVHALLLDGKEHTTLDIVLEAKVCAVNSCIDELRAPINGCDIECKRRGEYWYYRMNIKGRAKGVRV